MTVLQMLFVGFYFVGSVFAWITPDPLGLAVLILINLVAMGFGVVFECLDEPAKEGK